MDRLTGYNYANGKGKGSNILLMLDLAKLQDLPGVRVISLVTDDDRCGQGLRADSLEYSYARRDMELLLHGPITREVVLCTLEVQHLRLPPGKLTTNDIFTSMEPKPFAAHNEMLQSAFTKSLAFTRSGGEECIVEHPVLILASDGSRVKGWDTGCAAIAPIPARPVLETWPRCHPPMEPDRLADTLLFKDARACAVRRPPTYMLDVNDMVEATLLPLAREFSEMPTRAQHDLIVNLENQGAAKIQNTMESLEKAGFLPYHDQQQWVGMTYNVWHPMVQTPTPTPSIDIRPLRKEPTMPCKCTSPPVTDL